MSHIRPVVVAALVLLLAGAGLIFDGRGAAAEAPLPYVAYGGGLTRGQVVEALVGDRTVGHTTADAAGHWKLTIEARDAVNGDTIVFTLDGVTTGKSVQFQGGRFPLPPGIILGTSSGAPTASPPAAPARAAVAPARPGGAPRPQTGCTRAGRTIPCARPATKPPVHS